MQLELVASETVQYAGTLGFSAVVSELDLARGVPNKIIETEEGRSGPGSYGDPGAPALSNFSSLMSQTRRPRECKH